MAIGALSLIEVTLVQSFLAANAVYNVFQYEVQGELGSPDATDWAEAWWNHVKATYRAIAPTGSAPFRSVIVRELDNATGEYGEFAIPTAEQTGTRADPGGDWLPMFVAGAVRLTVATRVTRPGQKRFSYLKEGDLDGQFLGVAYTTAVNALMVVLTSTMLLGAPALGSEIEPHVVRKSPTTGLPIAHQPVTGFLINPEVTHQVSRRVGRGI